MSRLDRAKNVLQGAHIAHDIFLLRPDYRVLLMIAEGIPPGPSDALSEALLSEAEQSTRELLRDTTVTELKHISAWREAYKAFGVKPKTAKSSLEALTRRVAAAGLPRINRLTDIYNAISIKHQVPIGGEDLDKYDGSPFLIRATGKEQFQTFASGEPQVDFAAPGEPVWCDGGGITCRRWNWRQGPRTALDDKSTGAVFILDALEALSDEHLRDAADELESILKKLSPSVTVTRRVMDSASCAKTSSE